jgi:hypothetical protein
MRHKKIVVYLHSICCIFAFSHSKYKNAKTHLYFKDIAFSHCCIFALWHFLISMFRLYMRVET